jgi:molybdate transport system substrate-binding protein
MSVTTRLRITVAACAALVLTLSTPARPAAQANAPAGGALLVSAAASLTDAMTAIAHDYEQASGAHVTLNFGASSALARQITGGAPVDFFMSADEAQMDLVAKAGLLEPGSRIDLLSNQLVVIMPKRTAHQLGSIRDLASDAFKRIATADPSAVPVGVYTKRYLESQQLWTAIGPKIVPTLDVRAALAAADSGNVDAAFVYRTDAAISKQSTIVFAVPREQGPKITYPAALVKGGPHLDAARRFLHYVRGSAARSVFERFGFVVIGGADR